MKEDDGSLSKCVVVTEVSAFGGALSLQGELDALLKHCVVLGILRASTRAVKDLVRNVLAAFHFYCLGLDVIPVLNVLLSHATPRFIN